MLLKVSHPYKPDLYKMAPDGFCSVFLSISFHFVPLALLYHLSIPTLPPSSLNSSLADG